MAMKNCRSPRCTCSATTLPDFLAFSAHKAYGPTGVGFLVAAPELLEELEPVQGGGEMIREVHLDRATWNEV
ncbi:MAG TPA: aminotransferase class V-fold PLP-dependent enzyme, partial [Steroidobacteraceae bacterium]|nr:aminotransferase class V-fold PLP-dependent enzyme [Steroidobacteraceae bacterium]